MNNLAHLVEPEILDIRIQKAGYNNAKICKNKENKRASMTVAKRVLHCVRATLKNHAKYEKMCDAIEPEKRVAAFLYLVPNYELRYGITDALCQMKQLVLFALVDKFTKDCSDMRVRNSLLQRVVSCVHQGDETANESGLQWVMQYLPIVSARRKSEANTQCPVC